MPSGCSSLPVFACTAGAHAKMSILAKNKKSGEDIANEIYDHPDECGDPKNGGVWAPLPKGQACGQDGNCDYPKKWCSAKAKTDKDSSNPHLSCEDLSPECQNAVQGVAVTANTTAATAAAETTQAETTVTTTAAPTTQPTTTQATTRATTKATTRATPAPSRATAATTVATVAIVKQAESVKSNSGLTRIYLSGPARVVQQSAGSMATGTGVQQVNSNSVISRVPLSGASAVNAVPVPGAVPVALSGAVPGAVSGAAPVALSGAVPGAVSGVSSSQGGLPPGFVRIFMG